MDKQGITADKKTVFDLKFFIKWGIAIGVPCILYFAIPQTEAVSRPVILGTRSPTTIPDSVIPVTIPL